MQLQCYPSKQLITLDTRNVIASGGEGRIYAVLQNPSLAAKIYHKPTDEDAEKLMLMFGKPPDVPIKAPEPGHTSIAWPINLLQASGSKEKIVGFLMSRVTKVAPIHTFYTPKTRREQKPLFDYRYLHRTAQNLAAAVSAVHFSGYVIGDVNESNILVTDTALVTLVDTDSFQVRDPYTGYVYRCPVGKPEFTPPELQGQTFRNIDRTPENDLFGLGVLIFQLLMEGTHPFAGVYQDSDEPPPIEARIKSGYFPYSTKRVPFRPMPAAPSLEILHPTLRQMLIRCFEEGHHNPHVRPDAKSWLSALKEAEDKLVSCVRNPQHKYGSHLRDCPWCDRAKLLKGRDPFPSRQAVESGQNLQPIPTKRKQLTPPKTQPVNVISQPRRSPAPQQRLTRQFAQYQPPISVSGMSSSRTSPPSPPVGSFQGFMQDTLWGTLWGGLCLAAILGANYAISDRDGGVILGAIFVGTIWGIFFGVIWGVLSLPPNYVWQKWQATIFGGITGAFCLTAIAGAVFGVVNNKPGSLEAIALGIFFGTIWGATWNIFKLPWAMPVGRLWGRQGAFFGWIWGAFLGTLIGAFLGVIFTLLPTFNGQNIPLIDFTKMLAQAIVIWAGLGCLGGSLFGSFLGVCGASPKLPGGFQPSGSKGAFLGSIWGTFLGAIASAILGGMFYTALSVMTSGTVVISPLVAAIVSVTGLGAIWGLFSGGLWGAFGRW
ncbi:DNA-binding protein [Oscillatoriales cyanobacterium USR001]|nr:DNA-binding protein [Oscillatoriales cyanobacterium USR001]